MTLDPRFGPAENEERQWNLVGLKGMEKVKDANLDVLPIFRVFLLDSGFCHRIYALIETVDDNQSVWHSVDLQRSEWLHYQLVELNFERLVDNDTLSQSCSY